MADENSRTASVELTDAVRAGFEDAMSRVESLGLKANGTLVDGISREAWTSWDASHEMAIVIDTAGPDAADCEDDLLPAAA